MPNGQAVPASCPKDRILRPPAASFVNLMPYHDRLSVLVIFMRVHYEPREPFGDSVPWTGEIVASGQKLGRPR